jgi:hypothetical protein
VTAASPLSLEDHYGANMTKREIATLSFKVLSVYAFLQAIDKSYDILYYFIYKDQLRLGEKLNLIMTSAPPLLSAICGIVLWFMAPLLAASIFKSIAPDDGSQASLVNLQVAAFSVVGLFILATGFPNLVNVVLMMLTAAPARAMTHTIVVLVLKIALGLWLLLGSHRIVNFIRSTQRD